MKRICREVVMFATLVSIWGVIAPISNTVRGHHISSLKVTLPSGASHVVPVLPGQRRRPQRQIRGGGRRRAQEVSLPKAILVAFKPDVSDASRSDVARRLGLLIDPKVTSPYFVRLLPARGRITTQKLSDLVKSLNADPAVRVAEVDGPVFLDGEPNDPSFFNQWGLNNEGEGGGVVDADIDAPEAWETTRGSAAVRVAIIDSGVNYLHADLSDNILRRGDGTVIGYDFGDGDSDPMDREGHGTHVAGIIGARGDNGRNVSGVSQQVSIIPLKFTSGSRRVGVSSSTINSIDFAIANGAKIINTSYGHCDFSQLELEAVQRARDAGVLFVASAGNGTCNQDQNGDNNDVLPHYPSNFNLKSNNVIAVAATDRGDRRTYFSSMKRRPCVKYFLSRFS